MENTKNGTGMLRLTEKALKERRQKQIKQGVLVAFGVMGMLLFYFNNIHKSPEEKAERKEREVRSANEKRIAAERDAASWRSDRETPAEAWRRADADNRKIDQAMEDMLENYRRKSKRTTTTSEAGVRVDTFEMADGSIVTCGTTIRNNARSTSCTDR